MGKGRFQSSVNVENTRSFPGADIGRDHELEMMTFRLRLHRMKNQGNVRSGSVMRNSRTPTSQNFCEQRKEEKFASLLVLDNQDTEIDALIKCFKTANNILGKHRPAKKPWVTDNIPKAVRQTQRTVAEYG